MKHNIYQGRLILSQGWVDKAKITAALQHLQKKPTTDLCELLMQNRLLQPNQALMVRQKTAQVLGSSATSQASPSDQLGATGINVLLNSQAVNRTKDFLHTTEVARSPTERIQAVDLDSQKLDDSQRAVLGSQVSGISPGLLSSLSREMDAPIDFAQPEIDLEAGKSFQDYELISEVSRGAMGVIFRAFHRPTQETVALKFMLDTLMNETERVRFQREAQTLIQLNHPNIVEITDFGQVGKRQFLAMQLIEGKDLHSRIKESVRLHSLPPHWKSVIPYFIDIADALKYCHERDVLHRDVKPSNILIETLSDSALLVDFGLIKFQKPEDEEDNDQARLTKSQEIVGTPQFMSPEQFSPGGSYGEVGPKTDVWGFGATMFYVLTGEYLFGGRTMIDIFDAVTNKKARTAKELNPDIPDWLSALCFDCFGKHVKERPQMDYILATLRREHKAGQKPVIESRYAGHVLVLKIFIAFLMSLILVIIVHLGSGDSSAKFLDVGCSTTPTKNKFVEVKGRTDIGSVAIKIVNRAEMKTIATLSARSNPDGSFYKKVSLDQGMNRILVSIDSEASLKQSKEFEIFHDSIPPSVEIKNEFKKGRYLIKDDLLLRGKVFDTSKIDKLLVDGQPQEINSDGSFVIKVRYRGSIPIRLTVFDALSNKSDLRISVMTYSEFKREFR
jgi:serine/threonine protein kinase